MQLHACDEKKRFMLALIAPAVLALIFFQVLPILDRRQRELPRLAAARSQETWVGFTNYVYVLRDNEFL